MFKFFYDQIFKEMMERKRNEEIQIIHHMSHEKVKETYQFLIKFNLINYEMETFETLVRSNPSVLDSKFICIILCIFINRQSNILINLIHKSPYYESNYVSFITDDDNSDICKHFSNCYYGFNNNVEKYLSADYILNLLNIKSSNIDISILFYTIHLLNEDVFNFFLKNHFLLKYIFLKKNEDTMLTLCIKLYNNIKYQEEDNVDYPPFNKKIVENNFGVFFDYKKILLKFMKILISLNSKLEINIVKDLLKIDPNLLL